MIQNFEQLRRMTAIDEIEKESGLDRSAQTVRTTVRTARPVVAVANAADREVIETVKEMRQQNIADAILTGCREEIEVMCRDVGMEELPEIWDADGETAAAEAAVRAIRGGRAQVLMKGLVNSRTFLKAVLDSENGLRRGRSNMDESQRDGLRRGRSNTDESQRDGLRENDRNASSLLCHLAAFEVPGWPKLQFHTDGGMNLFPNLEQKRQILQLSVEALHRMGVERPKVAVLSANEVVNPKLQSSVDAAQLQKWNEEGVIGGCIVEGPMAMDVALSKEAAVHKHIQSKIAGDTDLFLVPNIEAGNMVGKTMMYCAKAKMAGVILGAACPIVMVSRADNAQAKLNSLALALLCIK